MPRIGAPRMRAATTAVVALGALLGVAGTAAASTSGGTAVTREAKVPKTDGSKALCRRVPRIDKRIDRALKRLNGGENVRGSVARLQKRVDNAKKENHTSVEDYLNDRLTFRRSLISTLQQRQDDLKDVKTWCQAQKQSNGSTSSSPTASTGSAS